MGKKIRGALAGLLTIALFILTFSSTGFSYTFSLTETSMLNTVTVKVSEGTLYDESVVTTFGPDDWSASTSAQTPNIYAEANTDIVAFGDGNSLLSINHFYSEYASDIGSFPNFSKADFGNQSASTHTFSILGGTGQVTTTISADEWAWGDPVYPDGGGFTIRKSNGEIIWNWNVGSGASQSDVLLTAGELYSIDTSFGYYWRSVTTNHSPQDDFIGPLSDDRICNAWLDITVAGDPDTPPGPDPNAVPEPLSVLLLGLGLGCLTVRKYLP